MIIVLFEVTIKKDHMEQYVSMAGDLKGSLAKARGFIRAERFSSLSNEGKLLSLSVWEDEEAVQEWRNNERHRMNQQRGRDSIFGDCVITVVSPVRTYSDQERIEAPEDSNKAWSIAGIPG